MLMNSLLLLENLQIIAQQRGNVGLLRMSIFLALTAMGVAGVFRSLTF
jgi:hypothetical protein